MTLIFLVILAALVFTYINGFHDTANSIATVVDQGAIAVPSGAARRVTNLIGALRGTAVASTIASGLVDPKVATSLSADLCPARRNRVEPAHMVVWHAGQLVAMPW